MNITEIPVVPDSVSMGANSQEKADIFTGYTPDGQEKLSWINVETTKLNDKEYLVLIASKGVATVPFHSMSGISGESNHEVYFDNSYLNKWLKEAFMYQFFDERERSMIHSVSIPESMQIKKWFPVEYSRVCVPAAYAIHQGASVYNNDFCAYWLSDTGRRVGKSATVVMSNGKIYKSAYMLASNICVRPIIVVERKEQSR